MEEILEEDFYSVSDYEFLWAAMVSPIERIIQDYQEHRISSYIGRELLRRHLDNLSEEIGGFWSEPGWEEIIAKNSAWEDHFWDACDMREYTIWVKNSPDADLVIELAGGDPLPDLCSIAEKLCHIERVPYVLLDDMSNLYVMKSEYMYPDGVHIGQSAYGQMLVQPVPRGSTCCYALPKDVLDRVASHVCSKPCPCAEVLEEYL